MRWPVYLLVGLLLIGFGLTKVRTGSLVSTLESVVTAAPLQPNSPERRDELLAQSPILFERNQGQTEPSIKFLARGPQHGVYLTNKEAIFAIPANKKVKHVEKGKFDDQFALTKGAKNIGQTFLRMTLLGANENSTVQGLHQLNSYSNYFVGRDAALWQSNVPHYGQVRFSAIYPGIDLVYYGNQRELEYDFIVGAGADPRQILFDFTGASKVFVNDLGELVLRTSAGEMKQHKPVVYQEINGVRSEVAARYMVNSTQVRFVLGTYDRNYPLVIDPSIVYSSYLGGSDLEIGNGIEADAAGNAYVTGVTYSADFPVKNSPTQSLGGAGNSFIAKYNSTGQLVFNTYLGGNSEDVGFAIALDAAANIYVTGATDSTNFPVTAGAPQKNKIGGYDGYIAKLSANGNQLVYATYLGGSRDEISTSLAVDSLGNACVVGQTSSPNFPTLNALQNSLAGTSDAFVTKLNANGNAYISSTYLGGRGQEIAYGINLDATSNIYLTGITYSDNFPIKNASQSIWGGRVDGFLTKLSSGGNSLVYSTYFGGSHDDGGFGVGLDGAGNVYVTGFSSSLDFPTRAPFQAANAGNDDAIIAKYDLNGTLVFASYHGGASADRGFDLAVDRSGNAYLVGRTDSPDFPLKDALQSRLGGLAAGSIKSDQTEPVADKSSAKWQSDWLRGAGRNLTNLAENESVINSVSNNNLTQALTVPLRDSFLTKVSPTGRITYSTFLGGTDEDSSFSVAIDNQGNAYLAGLTASANFPVQNAVQGRLNGISDAAVTKITDASGTQASVSAANYSRTLARGMIVAAFGKDFSTETQLGNTIPLPTNLAGTSVLLKDSTGQEHEAPLFFVSPNQINYLIPAEAANGFATIAVYRGNALVSTETAQVLNNAPGLFTFNADGTGIVTGNLLRIKANGAQSYEDLVRFDNAQNKFVALPIDMGALDDSVFLVLYGTGMRNMSGSFTKSAKAGGLDSPVLYVGPQGSLVGLDQVNLQLSRALVGRGEVDIQLTVDGMTANTVKVAIK